MATATAKRSPDEIPAVSGLAKHQTVGFIPDVHDAPAWLQELAQRHREAAIAFTVAVDAHGRELDGEDEAAMEHRRAVRRALAAGEAPPTPPDPEIARARQEVAEEDARAAQDNLDLIALEAMAAMRARRAELVPHLGAFDDALLDVLLVGGGSQDGFDAVVREKRAREVRALDRLKKIDDVDADPAAGAPEPGEVLEVSHA